MWVHHGLRSERAWHTLHRGGLSRWSLILVLSHHLLCELESEVICLAQHLKYLVLLFAHKGEVVFYLALHLGEVTCFLLSGSIHTFKQSQA